MADEKSPKEGSQDRRSFILTLVSLGALIPSYGLFAAFAGRFLYPRKPKKNRTKMFIGFTHDLRPKESIQFSTPAGERFLLTHTGAGVNPYQAFSSRCPHLGCKVHWEGDKQRFYCPCHGGAFRPDGVAVEGPPAQAKQSLKPCEIVVEGSSLYAMVELS